MEYFKALFYEKSHDGLVNCKLCPHFCSLMPDKVGKCRVRKNIDGDLYSLNYGKISSAGIDPIEKKPLKNFMQGSNIFSIGTLGCNLKCQFCQNYSIAHENTETAEAMPIDIVNKALELKNSGNIGIAFTYNEPLMWYEFVYETSKLSKENGLVNVLVTNGFINEEPLKRILPFINAMNIDLKAYSDDFYKNICSGRLDNVKRTIEISVNECHVELTTLVVPGLNDSEEEISSMVDWIASISNEIPLHLTRFFPNYKMLDLQPTPISTMKRLKEIAQKSLKYVHLGNV